MNTASTATFDFSSADFDIEIPSNAGSVQRANQLPFKDWYTKHSPTILSGEAGQAHLFVPRDYWIKERGADPEKCTTTFQKGKLRAQFNEWADANDPEGCLEIIMVNRDASSQFKQEGTSLWLRKAEKPAKREKAEPKKK